MGDAKRRKLQQINELQEALEKQEQRYTEEELRVIRGTYKNNDTLLRSLRKFFLQGELDNDDYALIDGIKKNPKAIGLLKKDFLKSEFDPSAPSGAGGDTFSLIDTKTLTTEYVWLFSKARMIVNAYFEQMIDLLENGTEPKIIFKNLKPNKDKNQETTFIELDARNNIVGSVDYILDQKRYLALTTEETPAEQAERMLKDSNE